MPALERYALVRFPAVGGLLIARAGDGWDDVVVKRSTAITRLRDVADGLTRTTSWPDVGIVAGFVFGALIEHTGDLERVELALMVDARPEEVPWLARPARLEATAAQLRFDSCPWLGGGARPMVRCGTITSNKPFASGPPTTASTSPWSTHWLLARPTSYRSPNPPTTNSWSPSSEPNATSAADSSPT